MKLILTILFCVFSFSILLAEDYTESIKKYLGPSYDEYHSKKSNHMQDTHYYPATGNATSYDGEIENKGKYIKSNSDYNNYSKENPNIPKPHKADHAIIIWSILVIIVLIVGFGACKTFEGEAVFFNGYGDLFLSYISFIIFIIALFNTDKQWGSFLMILAIIGMIVYNCFIAFRYNSQNIFLGFCIGIGRLTLGYLIPIAIIFLYFSGSGKRSNETDTAYQIRYGIDKLQRLTIIAGLAYFLNKLVKPSRKNKMQ